MKFWERLEIYPVHEAMLAQGQQDRRDRQVDFVQICTIKHMSNSHEYAKQRHHQSAQRVFSDGNY
ncbi:MAG: hypothetical protein V7L04_09505 [Nostoc sp.]